MDNGSRETTKPTEESELEQNSHKVKKPRVSNNTSSLSNHDFPELRSKEKIEVDMQNEMSVATSNHEEEDNESRQSDSSDIPNVSVSVSRKTLRRNQTVAKRRRNEGTLCLVDFLNWALFSTSAVK